jgi:hypothetical protein
MNNEILDDLDPLKNKTEAEIKAETDGNLFPFILLVLSFCSLPFFQPFNLAGFIGAGFLLCLNAILILRKRRIGIIFTGFLCIFASINLVNFFPFEMIAFGLSTTLGFDYISTPIFLGSYVLSNEEIFLDFRNKFISNRNKNSTVTSKVDYFKKRFEHKNIKELQSILDNPSMIDDAKKAAAELLETKF